MQAQENWRGRQIYLTADPEVAKRYGRNVYEVSVPDKSRLNLDPETYAHPFRGHYDYVVYDADEIPISKKVK